MSTATATQAIRVPWTRWFHCESSFSLSLVPNAPGIFAIAEQTAGAGARNLSLNIIQVQAADDLFHALNHLYSHDCPLRERLEKSRCFIRYAAVDDAGVRQVAASDLQRWLDSPGETDSPFVKEFRLAFSPAEGPYRTKGD